MNNASFIKTIQNIVSIPLEKIEEIISHFESISIAKDEYFIKAGYYSDKYIFLEQGSIRAYTIDIYGNEITTEFYLENQFVFEVASFFQRTISKESFQAMEDCEARAISFEKLQYLFHTIPEFRELGRMILVKGFIRFKQRTLSHINETAEQRYENLVNAQPQLFQKASLKHIASYLGITDTSLSRIRREITNK